MSNYVITKIWYKTFWNASKVKQQCVTTNTYEEKKKSRKLMS